MRKSLKAGLVCHYYPPGGFDVVVISTVVVSIGVVSIGIGVTDVVSTGVVDATAGDIHIITYKISFGLNQKYSIHTSSLYYAWNLIGTGH